MADFRSQSCRDGRMQIETYHGNKTASTGMRDLRSYSTSTVDSIQPNYLDKEITMKRAKGSFGSSSKSWRLNDPEWERKKRVAGYKIYAAEGKMKGSWRKSVRWIKNTWSQVVYGWQ